MNFGAFIGQELGKWLKEWPKGRVDVIGVDAVTGKQLPQIDFLVGCLNRQIEKVNTTSMDTDIRIELLRNHKEVEAVLRDMGVSEKLSVGMYNHVEKMSNMGSTGSMGSSTDFAQSLPGHTFSPPLPSGSREASLFDALSSFDPVSDALQKLGLNTIPEATGPVLSQASSKHLEEELGNTERLFRHFGYIDGSNLVRSQNYKRRLESVAVSRVVSEALVEADPVCTEVNENAYRSCFRFMCVHMKNPGCTRMEADIAAFEEKSKRRSTNFVSAVRKFLPDKEVSKYETEVMQFGRNTASLFTNNVRSSVDGWFSHPSHSYSELDVEMLQNEYHNMEWPRRQADIENLLPKVKGKEFAEKCWKCVATGSSGSSSGHSGKKKIKRSDKDKLNQDYDGVTLSGDHLKIVYDMDVEACEYVGSQFTEEEKAMGRYLRELGSQLKAFRGWQEFVKESIKSLVPKDSHRKRLTSLMSREEQDMDSTLKKLRAAANNRKGMAMAAKERRHQLEKEQNTLHRQQQRQARSSDLL